MPQLTTWPTESAASRAPWLRVTVGGGLTATR
jgi:hypothetical protein